MKPLAPILAVTFDAGGTLIHPWPSVGHVYATVAAEHGVPNLPPQQLNDNFAAAWRAKRNFSHTREDWTALVDRTFAGLCDPLPSRTFFPDVFERFAQPDAWRVYDDVLPALDALVSRGLRLAVISNWDDRLRPLLERLRLDTYFDAIVVSCEVAFAKPSPVVFGIAAQKLGAPADQILHVGDSLSEDYEGAKAAGFEARLIDRQGSPRAGHVLRSLRELELIVPSIDPL
jgi:putative hydrolase of the HAD superfamily